MSTLKSDLKQNEAFTSIHITHGRPLSNKPNSTFTTTNYGSLNSRQNTTTNNNENNSPSLKLKSLSRNVRLRNISGRHKNTSRKLRSKPNNYEIVIWRTGLLDTNY